MKKSVIYLGLILTFTMSLVSSCAHKPVEGRTPASTDCESAQQKGEYHSYFDSVEKCME